MFAEACRDIFQRNLSEKSFREGYHLALLVLCGCMVSIALPYSSAAVSLAKQTMLSSLICLRRLLIASVSLVE